MKAKKDNHFISVTIPTAGRSTLRGCLSSLEAQTRRADEIIVIEDKERRGVSWARNEGIRKSTGDLVAFIDDDCASPKNWLKELVSAIDKYNASGAGGTYDETDPFLREVRLRRKFPRIEQEDVKGIVGIGGNVMYRKEWLEICIKKDGYIFNESFEGARGGEDFELAWRLRRYGAKLVFVPIMVEHFRQVSFLEYLKLQFNRGVGVASLFKEHRSRDSGVVAQKSLLWGEGESTRRVNWVGILWKKVIGPFDVRSFSRFDYFLRFWLGEKVQGLGFLWGLLRH